MTYKEASRITGSTAFISVRLLPPQLCSLTKYLPFYFWLMYTVYNCEIHEYVSAVQCHLIEGDLWCMT